MLVRPTARAKGVTVCALCAPAYGLHLIWRLPCLGVPMWHKNGWIVAKLGSPSSDVGMVFVRDSANRKDIKMQTQASQQHNQLGRIAGIAMVMSCAAVIATLLTWAPSSIGSANDNPAPAKLSAMPAQAAGAKQAPADPAHGSSDSPTRPTCAELGGIEKTGESSGTVGCGVRSNLAGGTPASNQSEERLDVGTFLAWHVQARNLIQYAYQTTLSGPSRTEAKDDRPRRR
jgi:hypothetical protein